MKYLMIALVLSTVVTCANAERVTTDPRATQAEHLARQLMGQLKQELMAGLKKGSTEAIDICRLRAPQISEALTTSGVQIGRVSHRPRNLDNNIKNWQQDVMHAYLTQPKPQPAQSFLLPDGSLAYVSPIYMAPPCLRCHGEHISEQLHHTIAHYYPQDQAQGFKLGDFRGLTWVIIK